MQDKDNKANNAIDSTTSTQSITVSGVVKAIQNGKDGYIADIETEKNGTYAALVSIANLGGIKNFIRFKVGDKVTVNGILSILDQKKHLKVENITEVIKADGGKKTNPKLIITTTSFRGIKVGDKITAHSDYIKKDQLKTGEGDFTVYRIKDFNNNIVGYFLPDPNNESLVGDISIESEIAKTKEGIKVGDSFATLQKKLPTLEVHGSEIEGRTYASHNGLFYRLDIGMFSYKVDIKKIPISTKITEIIIKRKPVGK